MLLAGILFLSFLFFRSFDSPLPPGIELNISENLSSEASIFILDQFGELINSIETNEDFFPQQKGLSAGTIYGFRVINEKGELAMPVYETFTAKEPDSKGWEIGRRYYRSLSPGNYTIELLIIKNGEGIITARINFSSFSLDAQNQELEKKIRDNCSYLLNEPLVDVNGESRESRITKCTARIGIEAERLYACNLLFKIFNITNYDSCLIDYALATNNISICEGASMPKSRGFCKAKASKDWTECRKVSCDLSCAQEGLETQQDLCIQWYAIETRNVNLCNELKSSDYNMKEICQTILSGN